MSEWIFNTFTNRKSNTGMSLFTMKEKLLTQIAHGVRAECRVMCCQKLGPASANGRGMAATFANGKAFGPNSVSDRNRNKTEALPKKVSKPFVARINLACIPN